MPYHTHYSGPIHFCTVLQQGPIEMPCLGTRHHGALFLLCAASMQVALGEAVERACQQQALAPDGGFKFLYDTSLSIKQKIEAIAIGTYGAAAVEYLPQVLPLYSIMCASIAGWQLALYSAGWFFPGLEWCLAWCARPSSRQSVPSRSVNCHCMVTML